MAVPPRSLAVSLTLACAFAPGTVRAYSAPEGFIDRPSDGGGGGRWFSGSPAEGFGCSVCHQPGQALREFPFYATGVPKAYSPGVPQQIVLNWPEFAQRWTELRPDPSMPPPPTAQAPAVGLVTELVAESGKASGTIEIAAPAASDPSELCERARPNLQPRVAVRVYQVRPGKEPTRVKADDAGALRCSATQLGQRCIVALTGCGAKQLRMTWTPPLSWEGPIWFSAGFVATDALSGTPDLDSVQEMAVPIVQATTASGVYHEKLQSGCTLVRGPRPARGAALAGLLAGLLLIGRRARRKDPA